ncbi:phage holin, LLH family [Tautonia plasticadhaerens]|uniref:Phage holin protein (Holin_LLH) n=1 Tax=Tautonia plasticadhaerens TaxID=2527974 RepID=A0A518H234_9BACT|nr:phage holin, LLH family [Tautonia plasticadhaerens]QDV34887.1 Phage holin protein (Holin_LLH) [Tautonia plasticadhaerens]
MNLLQRLFNKFIGYLLPAAKLLARAGGEVLISAAKEAVLAAERQGGSGKDKYNAARKALVINLQAQSIPLIDNAINLAIESAVAALNDK